jgi:hypothetical protein
MAETQPTPLGGLNFPRIPFSKHDSIVRVASAQNQVFDCFQTTSSPRAAKFQKWIDENCENERLKDGAAGAANETSIVFYGDFGPALACF